jgi:hypothetical protein
MPPAVRFPIVLVLVALFSSVTIPPVSRAQESPAAFAERQKTEAKEEVVRLLKSGTPRDRAWAAHLCVKHGLKEFAPQLVAALNPEGNFPSEEAFIRFTDDPEMAARRLNAPPTDAETKARLVLKLPTFLANQAILNALIHFKENIPPETAMGLRFGHLDAVVILLLRDARANAKHLFSILSETPLAPRSVRRAILWSLTDVNAPELTVFLLRQPIRVEIYAVDPPSEKGIPGGIPGGKAGVIVLRGNFNVPKDFPPIGFHLLAGDGLPNGGTGTRLVEGNGMIFIQESDCPADANCRPSALDSWPMESEYAYSWSVLLDQSPGTSPYADVNASIPFHSEESFRKSVEDILAGIEKRFDRIKLQLLEQKRLTRAEFETIKPDIRLSVSDYRVTRDELLPTFPNRNYIWPLQ